MRSSHPSLPDKKIKQGRNFFVKVGDKEVEYQCVTTLPSHPSSPSRSPPLDPLLPTLSSLSSSLPSFLLPCLAS